MASAQTLAIAGVAGIVGLVLLKYSDIGKGIVTGDNALTRGATNAEGQAVTAYQGAGPVGTLGAAANAASGGYLATLGQWLGDKAFDVFGTDQADSQAPAAADDVTFTKPAGVDAGYTLPVSRELTFSEASGVGYDWRGYGWGVVEP